MCLVEEKVLHFAYIIHVHFLYQYVYSDWYQYVYSEQKNTISFFCDGGSIGALEKNDSHEIRRSELFLRNSMKNFLSNFLDTLPLMYIMYMYVVVM